MIDLHVHSTFSDGSHTPAELVSQAAGLGLTAVALTDHDTTDGVVPFLEACRSVAGAGLLGIPGVEISADSRNGTMHILGYFVDVKAEALEETLVRIREGRAVRNVEIVERLNGLGLAVTLEEVAAFAGDDVVGRPHFAAALIKRGFVKSKTEAFEKYLAKGKPAYADRFRLSPEVSIAVIRAAGGAPVLAHPLTLDLSNPKLRTLVGELREVGLQGVEVYYPEHTPAHIKQYLTLAREFDLVVTGGSDFHGTANPAIRLGSGFGTLNVPDDLVEPLRGRCESGGVS